MSRGTRQQVIFYVDSKDDREKLMRDAKRLGVTMTELITRSLKIGLPIVKKSLRKAQQEERSITEKT
jgi:hypothetical protein